MNSPKTKLIFLGLVALAFSLRSIYFNQTAEFIQPGTGSDSHFYLRWACDIVRGNVLGRDVFYALPLYPYFLSLAYLFSGGETFGLILIQLFIGAVNCGLIYVLGEKLFNKQTAIFASLIACAYPMFIFYDRMLLPSSLAIFLGLSLTLLLLRIRDNPTLARWLGAGLFLGLCTLAGASFSLSAIFILFWIIYEFKKKTLKRRLLYCGAFILSFSLIVAATTLRNYLVAKDTVLITAHSGINFYIGNNSQANGLFKVPPNMRPTQSGLLEDAQILAEKVSTRRLKASEMSDFWTSRSLNFIRNQPLDYLRLLGKKLVLFLNGKEHIDEIEYYIYKEKAHFSKAPLFNFSLVCPLAILGMFLSWAKRKEVMLLYISVFSLSLATTLFFINSRYRLIVVPYLIIFAGYAFWRVFALCKKRLYKNFIFSLVLFFALFFLINVKITGAGSPSTFVFHYNKGIYLSDQADFRKAQKEFQAALALSPYDFMSYHALGNVYYQMWDFPRAIDCYRKSLVINPYFCDAHFNLAMACDKIGQKQQAQRQFKEVLKLKPNDCPAHYNLGRVYQEQGLIDLALKEYEQALAIKPGHREILKAIEEISKK